MDITYIILVAVVIIILAVICYQRIQRNYNHQYHYVAPEKSYEFKGNEVMTVTNQTTNSSSNKSSKGQNRNQSGSSGMSGGVNKRIDSKGHSHPWLVTTLKGHTSEIQDMNFSNNGKYLASCAEDNNIGSSNSEEHNSASNNLASGDDINSSSSSEDTSVTSSQCQQQSKKKSKNGRNRKQRKNQNNSQNVNNTRPSSPQQVPINMEDDCKENEQAIKSVVSKVNGKSKSSALPLPVNTNIDKFTKISRALTPPLRQYTKLNLQESELVKFLQRYVINSDDLLYHGYPIESSIHIGSVEIYKYSPGLPPEEQYGYYYRAPVSKDTIINSSDGLNSSKKKWEDSMQVSCDSGQESGSSSPPSFDGDASENEETTSSAVYYVNGSYQIYGHYNQSLEKKCVRCKRFFSISKTGEYFTKEECTYHWGKVFEYRRGVRYYTCCNSELLSEGCTKNHVHVWNGISNGLNGPYQDFVKTESRCNDDDDGIDTNGCGRVYALDCEMCYTGLGLELTKVTLIGYDGQLVYEHFVKPKCEIVDYNTRFSGITEKDLSSKNGKVKTLKEVQKDLLQLISADTILIGHSLENDLRVLRIIHKNVIDTSIAFPHNDGFPYRKALKTLTKEILKRDIQTAENGHNSFEDSRACLELMLWRVRKDNRLALEK